MTTREIDSPVNTSWGLDSNLTKWIDYLRDETWEIIHDNEWNAICIYADSWFQEVPWTVWEIE